MSFQCTIVTPEQQALDEKAEQVILPAHDGQIGILTDRAPILVKLGVGPLRVDSTGGKQRFFLVDGGVAQMKENKLTILTTIAVPSAEISADTARAEYAEAEAYKAPDAKAATDRQRRMERARAAQALAGK
jgi:F-type H+-transporting ATPase subunit epsilon